MFHREPIGTRMIDKGSLVLVDDNSAAGSIGRGQIGIVIDAKMAWHADERDDTLLVNVLIPTTGEEIGFYDWQLREIDEGW